MFCVAFNHGLRVSEVIALTPDNVRDGFLDVQRLKGSQRTVQALMTHENPLLNEKSALLEYVRKSKRNQRLFPISRQWFWKLMKKYGRTADIPEPLLFPHVLKHSIAMQTIQTAGIENVRQHLGHKSGSSTMEYLKVSDEQASSAVGRALKGL